MPPRLALLATLALAACAESGPAVGTLRVLFIGNSLTYANDLPGTIAQIAAGTAGALEIEVRDVSLPDYALEDHWNTPQSIEVLNEGGWDVVILQQGPSSLPENQVNLREWATQFADRIRELGGRPALYMVWPDNTRLDFFDAVSQSYRDAAEAADAELYPAGEAWRAAWRADPSLPLYDADGFHPSAMGSYLAALTIYHGLTGRPVVGLTSAFPEDVARVLQEAAEEAVAQFGR
jgi:hypothetical protein